MRCCWIGLTVSGLIVVLAMSESARAQGDTRPVVIAHRGASGYLPEHTLAAYAYAYAAGADFIEPDLVRTSDGAFVCIHDIHLEDTTNVEDLFPLRKRADGRWYAADFSLAEVRRLTVHERLDGRFPKAASRFVVPTFEEMIELIQGLNQSTGRQVGIYPELKSSTFHAQEGLAMEEAFLEIVLAYGFERGVGTPIFVQSFDPESLERMRELGSTLPQILLFGGGGLVDRLGTDDGLQEVAGFADGIGPSKTLIVNDPKLVVRAHEAGLLVHPYTFRADSLGEGMSSFEEEIETFYEGYGVDGLFTDFPDRARAFLDSRYP